MILPTKYLPVSRCLLNVSSVMLQCLDKPKTLSELWNDSSNLYDDLIFERFILAIDLLYIMGTVEMCNGFIRKV